MEMQEEQDRISGDVSLPAKITCLSCCREVSQCQCEHQSAVSEAMPKSTNEGDLFLIDKDNIVSCHHFVFEDKPHTYLQLQAEIDRLPVVK